MGTYEVDVELMGFKRYVQKSVTAGKHLATIQADLSTQVTHTRAEAWRQLQDTNQTLALAR